jgi:uncharacterized protein (TIGR00725 family)
MEYKIAVVGSADDKICPQETIDKAKMIGREIAKNNIILVTGATNGIPDWAAKGCKEEGGTSIGISPAASELAHIKTYRLPTANYDIIMYTDAGYAGRDILMTRTSNAVVIICGRMGTLHEFIVAFESHLPIGVLVESGGIADHIKQITKWAGRYKRKKIIYEKEPKLLIQKLIKEIKKDKSKLKK